jgi:hypothetical protein
MRRITEDSVTLKRFKWLYLALLLTFLGVMSVSGTIALRNILHLSLLLLFLIYVCLKSRRGAVNMRLLVYRIPFPVWLWCLYLLLFPLIAPNSEAAWGNLLGKGMWGESILTWILAAGAFLILGPKRLTLWVLALVSAVPVFIHLAVTAMAWGGVLQPGFYEDPSLLTVFRSVIALLQGEALFQNPFQSFPIGFRGIEPMHGNLGYPASQAMCIGLAVMLSAWHKGMLRRTLQAGALVALCFLSVVIAQSRAATYFGLLILFMSFGLYFVCVRVHRRSLGLSLGAGFSMAGVAILCAAFFVNVASHNPVWYSMIDKMLIGFQIEKPKELICEGFNQDTIDFVKKQHPGKDEAYVGTLIDGLESDGGRVLLARVGLELSVEYKWGLNGGRDAYEYRIQQYCDRIPAMIFSHAHNAWINLMLALGWTGAALYASVLGFFAYIGRNGLRKPEAWPEGMALLLLALFWILRGLVDAVFQEHYLEMQAFFLLTLFLNLNSGKPDSK